MFVSILIGVVVVFLAGAITYALRAGRKAGEDAEQAKRYKDARDRVAKGRDAVRDGRDDPPDKRLRDNDGRWK